MCYIENRPRSTLCMYTAYPTHVSDSYQSLCKIRGNKFRESSNFSRLRSRWVVKLEFKLGVQSLNYPHYHTRLLLLKNQEDTADAW